MNGEAGAAPEPGLAHAVTAALLTGVDPAGESAAFTPAQRAALRSVQAFIVKVKHNAIRRELPCTFRLLAEAGLEIAFFTAFAPTWLAARRAGPIGRQDHLDLLRAAVTQFCAGGGTFHALLCDVCEHEYALRTTRHDARLRDGVFRFHGSCVVLCHRHDVLAITREGALPPYLAPAQQCLLYQHHPDGTTVIRALDALTAIVLRAASGAPAMAPLCAAASRLARRPVGQDVAGVVLAAVQEEGIGRLATEDGR